MRAVSTVASGLRHSAVAVAEALVVAAIIAALLLALSPVYKPATFLAGADAAQAAKGGRGSGTISVPDGVFASTTTATVNPGSDAWVRGRCYQGDSLVYEQYVRVDANNQAVLTLGPTPSWLGGSASCTGEELEFGRNARWRVLATTTFNVDG